MTRKGRVEIDLEIDEDFRVRIRTESPREAIEVVNAMMKEAERRRMRRTFFAAAHVVVFGVAALSVAGMVAHVLNLRPMNVPFLAGMGAWTVGTVIYLYFVIIRDVFGLTVKVPPPPPH